MKVLFCCRCTIIIFVRLICPSVWLIILRKATCTIIWLFCKCLLDTWRLTQVTPAVTALYVIGHVTFLCIKAGFEVVNDSIETCLGVSVSDGVHLSQHTSSILASYVLHRNQTELVDTCFGASTPKVTSLWFHFCVVYDHFNWKYDQFESLGLWSIICHVTALICWFELPPASSSVKTDTHTAVVVHCGIGSQQRRRWVVQGPSSLSETAKAANATFTRIQPLSASVSAGGFTAMSSMLGTVAKQLKNHPAVSLKHFLKIIFLCFYFYANDPVTLTCVLDAGSGGDAPSFSYMRSANNDIYWSTHTRPPRIGAVMVEERT